jgi:type IV pilus assembly protein PilE
MFQPEPWRALEEKCVGNKKTSAGFTLVELIIAVAIIGILAGVALPNYLEHLKRGKRSAAESFMLTLSNKQEQQMLNTRCYFSYPTDATCTPPTVTVPSEVQINYTVTITASMTSTPPGYTITAAPTAAFSDPKCGTLTYTNTGAKDASGTLGATSCWK